jgi:hypothetical protein
MQLSILKINIIVFLFAGILHSQSINKDDEKSNFEIINSLLNKNLELVENQFVLLGKDKVYCINVKGNGGCLDYFTTIFKQKFNNIKIVTEAVCSSSDYRIEFINVDFLVNYYEITGSVIKNKKVKRIISVQNRCDIYLKGTDSLVYHKNSGEMLSDEFYLDNLDAIERSNYSFTKGTLPEQSLWEKAFIPGIVAMASAVAVVLFFIIRSK